MLYASQQLGIYVNNFVDRLNYQSKGLLSDSKQFFWPKLIMSFFMNTNMTNYFWFNAPMKIIFLTYTELKLSTWFKLGLWINIQYIN